MKCNKRAGELCDSETRASINHAQALRLWLRMLACANLVERHVRSRLRNEFNITLPRFDLMAQLECSKNGMKMGELSRRMMVTCGNITGITNQLVVEGLVQRDENPSDRRAYIVKLTPEGRKIFKRMAEAHEEWVVELFCGMSEDDREQLYSLLALLKMHAATIVAKEDN